MCSEHDMYGENGVMLNVGPNKGYSCAFVLVRAVSTMTMFAACGQIQHDNKLYGTVVIIGNSHIPLSR